MTKAKKYLPLLTGLLLATGLFILLQLISYIRYENSDDILMVKSFMGFEGGVPAVYNLYLHTFLAHFMGWISALVPGVAWFSLFQLFLLWFSVAMVTKCVLQCAMARTASFWQGLLIALLFASVTAAFACARVNFTTTAAMAGAAAVAQLCSLAFADKRLFGSTFFSTLLLLACYALRPQSLLAALPFWLLCLLWVIITRRQGGLSLPRSFVVALMAGALCFACFAGVRAIEERQPAIQALIDFQDANLGPMDYDESAMLSVPDETLEAIGWSRAELALVRQWYFMDANITADAFRQLDAATATPLPPPQRIASAFQTLGEFYRDNGRYLTSALVLLLLCGLCVALPAEKNGLRATPIAAGLCLPLTAAMLLYLAYQGRFLSRAADCPLFSLAAFLCCLSALSMGGLPAAASPRRIAALTLVGLCLCAGGVNLLQTRRVLNDRPDIVSATREADLEAFALENPDMLILRTPDLLRDTRLLPDVSAGIPANIMIWGDWYCRTPSWYYQLEAYGFNGPRFSAADFLKDNLLFATNKEAPPEELLTYIEEGSNQNAVFSLYGQRGELRFFRFHPPSLQ